MKPSTTISMRIVKNSCILLAMFAIAQYVFAVSGIRIKSGEKDRNKKEQYTSGAFSNLKSSITFSIKDNYTFNQKNFGKVEFKTVEETRLPSSIISFKKGNTVYILPYKPQTGLKLPGFISMSPSESVSR